MIVRAAIATDIDEVISHNARQMKEPGYNGSLAHPFLPDYNHDWERRKTDTLASWSRPLTEERWSRSFILLEGEKVLGHLSLSNNFGATLHRAQLGMGIEMEARGQGAGTKLLAFAIEWARSQESLYWIDLSVFAHNTPAKKLYTNHGFVENFTYVDRFRLGGHVIDDTYMTLKLK